MPLPLVSSHLLCFKIYTVFLLFVDAYNIHIFEKDVFFCRYDKNSVVKLNGNANELARKEFKYLKKWDEYQQFTEVCKLSFR